MGATVWTAGVGVGVGATRLGGRGWGRGGSQRLGGRGWGRGGSQRLGGRGWGRGGSRDGRRRGDGDRDPRSGRHPVPGPDPRADVVVGLPGTGRAARGGRATGTGQGVAVAGGDRAGGAEPVAGVGAGPERQLRADRRHAGQTRGCRGDGWRRGDGDRDPRSGRHPVPGPDPRADVVVGLPGTGRAARGGRATGTGQGVAVAGGDRAGGAEPVAGVGAGPERQLRADRRHAGQTRGCRGDGRRRGDGDRDPRSGRHPVPGPDPRADVVVGLPGTGRAARGGRATGTGQGVAVAGGDRAGGAEPVAGVGAGPERQLRADRRHAGQTRGCRGDGWRRAGRHAEEQCGGQERRPCDRPPTTWDAIAKHEDPPLWFHA